MATDADMQIYSALTELLDSGQFSEFRKQLNQMPTVHIADFLENLSLSRTVLVFRMLSKENAVHVFSLLNPDTQQNIIKSITDKEINNIIDDLWVDDAIDMLEEMPANLVKKVLHNSSPEIRKLINQYLDYAEDSVGSIMTAEFVEFRKNITVKDAIDTLREISPIIETIYTCFITDETRILQGIVELKDLLLADNDTVITELIDHDPVVVTTVMDKEDAAKMLIKYDLNSLPVVDKENRLVGIVTIDDAVDVIVEEDTEDIQRMAGVSPSEKPYLQTTSWVLAKNRFPWLALGLILNIAVAGVLDSYSPIYIQMTILISFIPMLMGTGGNAGSQTSTIVIRGMAIDEIFLKDFPTVLFKEIGVSLLIGLPLGIFAAVRIYFTSGRNTLLALMVALSLLAAIFVGKVTGAILPMVAEKLNLDPALMASPLVTTVVDILTIIVYFNIAKVFFPTF